MAEAKRTLDEAYESRILQDPGPFFLSCDHASARLPPPYRWVSEDLCWVGTHWSYDLGAAALTEKLSARLGASALWSRFSRLLVDPNRLPGEPSFIPRAIEGQAIGLNRELSAADIESRSASFYRRYHDALDAAIRRQKACRPETLLLSIHSFTPCYRGAVREMAGGVLFDGQPALAEAFLKAVREQGWDFRANEPYSGFDGLIEGIAQHGRKHDCAYLELEVRQDLACAPKSRDALVEALARACEATLQAQAEA